MVPNVMPPPQEIKYFDQVQVQNLGTSGFNLINERSLYQIVNGTGPNQRIGKNIRVVGVVVRAIIETVSNVTATNAAGNNVNFGVGSPFTLDLIWDEQMNGTLAGVGDIYSQPTLGYSLPNPLNDHRFKFAKRTQIKNPSSGEQLVDFSYSCNKLVEYRASTGTGTNSDLSSRNLILTLACPADLSPSIQYSMRVLFVDA